MLFGWLWEENQERWFEGEEQSHVKGVHMYVCYVHTNFRSVLNLVNGGRAVRYMTCGMACVVPHGQP